MGLTLDNLQYFQAYNYFTNGAGCSLVEIDCLTGDHQVKTRRNFNRVKLYDTLLYEVNIWFILLTLFNLVEAEFKLQLSLNP